MKDEEKLSLEMTDFAKRVKELEGSEQDLRQMIESSRQQSAAILPGVGHNRVGTWTWEIGTGEVTFTRPLLFGLLQVRYKPVDQPKEESDLPTSGQWNDFIGSDDLDRFKARLHELLQDQASSSELWFEIVEVHGERLWISVLPGNVERDADGLPLRVKGIYSAEVPLLQALLQIHYSDRPEVFFPAMADFWGESVHFAALVPGYIHHVNEEREKEADQSRAEAVRAAPVARIFGFSRPK